MTRQLELDLTTPQAASGFLDDALSSCDLVAPEMQTVIKSLALSAARHLIRADAHTEVRERLFAQDVSSSFLSNPTTHEAMIRGHAVGLIEAIAALAIPRQSPGASEGQKIDPCAYWDGKVDQLTAFVGSQ